MDRVPETATAAGNRHEGEGPCEDGTTGMRGDSHPAPRRARCTLGEGTASDLPDRPEFVAGRTRGRPHGDFGNANR